MARYYPGALQRPLPVKRHSGRRGRTDGVILHVTAGGATSPFNTFRRIKASSVFWVGYEGQVEQYMDADLADWSSGAGSRRFIGIETASPVDGAGAWNPAQLNALTALIAWLWREYKFPLNVVTSSRAGVRGIGWHRLGVPATYWQKARRVSQTGGALWSSAVGKICPGDERIKQVPALVAGVARALNTPAPAPTPVAGSVPAAKPTRPSDYLPLLVDGVAGSRTVTEHQRALNRAGLYGGWIDGDYGPLTVKAWQTYLARRGRWYRGRIDGAHGPLTTRAEQNYLRHARLYRGRVDGQRGPLTIKALQRALNNHLIK